LDSSFDTDGRLITTFDTTHVYSDDNDHGYFVAIQPDGKIVVGGIKAGSVSYFALARYNSGGSLDTTFGADGKVVTDFNSLGV